ncbi:gliding motility-associated C-terminal domain-containing protein [Nonlabens sp.]|jgi:gliding motility-associated-like protein|uniref:T9SS type B sorting domain-containing protein n=1 Tax=Nonlabens sp. TaxID=1888209 RepID=UPI0039E66BE3
MKNFILCCISILFFTAFASAQEFAMTDGSFTTCTGSFTDSGGLTGNYTNGEDSIITFCSPFATDDMQVTFNSFALASGEFLFVYDGDDVTAPLIGVYLGMNSPGFILASAANTSGCITFRFRSDSTNVSAGWEATIACFDNCQSIASSVVSVPAPDTDNVIRICQGETINFTGSANFSNDSTGATYEFVLSDGTVVSGFTASETYAGPGIYRVDFVATDPTGCRDRSIGESSDVVIQVSTTPDFTGTQAADTSICFGESTDITGLVETTEFFANVAPPITGQTFLPDGSGVAYQTCIDVSGFNVGTTFQSASDLISVFINMEHSYMGDLDITLTAPDGSQVNFLDYPNSGGGRFLGQALDDNTNTPGVGETYTFTEGGAATATLDGSTAAVGFGAIMPPVDYLPEDPFSNFIGTPLNGLWCLDIVDNLGIDNGYIFEWGINFNPAIIPTAGSYEPGEVSEMWEANADITATNANVITVTPTVAGQNCYNFSFTDSFGCTYIETVCVNVAPEVLTAVPNDIIACQATGNATVDLTSRDSQILDLLNPALYDLTFFNSMVDATDATSPIAAPAAYNVVVDETVFVRVQERATGCFNVVALNVFYSTAAYTAVLDLEACDDYDNIDGMEIFDLTSQDAGILGSQSATEFSVSYFLTQLDADANINPIVTPAVFESIGETIFARVSNSQDPDCFATGTFDVIVNAPPAIAFGDDFFECQPAGAATIDLTSRNTQILNGLNATLYTVTQYNSRADAEADLSQVLTPEAYDVTADEIVFIRVQEIATGCYNIVEVNVSYATSAYNMVADIQVCDDTVNVDGIEIFDLTSQNAAILGSQSEAEFTVSHFLTQADADANINEIINPDVFESMGETIYVRVSNIQYAYCFSTGTYEVVVNASPSIGIAPDVTECDQSPIDGATAFDFSINDTDVLNGQSASAFGVSYHTTQSDADSGSSSISASSTVSGGVIYARIVDNATGCYNTSTFNFIVETCEVLVPEGFSPNNDTINDTFSIPGIDQFANFELKIFNRLGAVVYETRASNYVEFAGIPNTGLNSGDGLLPTGTYFYSIKFNDANKKDVASWVYINY